MECYPLAVECNNVRINIVDESFIVGLAATKLEEYDDDYWRTVTQYLCIEFVYDKPNILSKKEEIELLNSYLFEIADSTGFALRLNAIRCPSTSEFYEMQEKIEEGSVKELRVLEPYNEGMKLFVSAIQINDPELRFLNFYKILEHFSPIAVNIEANELMRKKLDAPRGSYENGDYIRSIFELANSMRDKFNDEDLIKAAFNTCFDFTGLFEILPTSIKKNIKKHINVPSLTYSTDREKIISAINIASKIIYKTRNKVVHAKSNYIAVGDEVSIDEFTELNEFMKQASSQTIRWYTRQPSHLKLSIIK